MYIMSRVSAVTRGRKREEGVRGREEGKSRVVLVEFHNDEDEGDGRTFTANREGGCHG